MTTHINFNSDWLTEFIKQFFRLLNRLSKPTVKSLTAILVLMTFWFLSVYFIGKHFYDTQPIWIVLLFCFIVSISWLIANIIIIAFGLATFAPLFDDIDLSVTEEELIVAGALNSIVYLTVILFLAYFYKFSMMKFLLCCSGYAIFGLIIIGICFMIVKTQNKK